MADFKLYNYQQAHKTIVDLMPRIKARLQAGNVLTLTIKENERSIDQNSMFHSLIGQIAKQAQHFGAQWDTESFKRFLIDQWAHETGRATGKVVPSLDGQRLVQLGLQSRKFSKQDASEFTEWLFAWGTNNGITFENIHEHKTN